MRCGGVVLTTKHEEIQFWIDLCRKVGREKDLVIFSPDSGEKYDAFHWEMTRPGSGSGDPEAMTDLLSTLMLVGRPVTSSSSNDAFWERGAEMAMRVAVHTHLLAVRPISLPNIMRFIEDLPTHPGEFESEEWQQRSYCAELLQVIRERRDALTHSQWLDLDIASRYICETWAQMDERPRSTIFLVVAGMADRFRYGYLRDCFAAGECTFNPIQAAEEGRIIINAFPVLEFGLDTGRLCSALIKTSFQQQFLRRSIREDSPIVFLVADEFQYHVLPRGRDNAFAQTCRGFRVATIYATQTILNLAQELGE